MQGSGEGAVPAGTSIWNSPIVKSRCKHVRALRAWSDEEPANLSLPMYGRRELLNANCKAAVFNRPSCCAQPRTGQGDPCCFI